MRQLHLLLKWFNLTTILVLSVFYLSRSGTSVLAQDSTLTLTGVQPDQAANDIDTLIEIYGSGFLNDTSDPQVFLDETQLTQVSWVDEETLTAQVPWGLKPGFYTLKVVNPDGAEATLATRFEVTQGINQWNTNAIDGGPVRVIMPIPSVFGQVYAYSVITSAIYRSDDYGEHWSTVGHAGGQYLTYDPFQLDTLFLNQLKSSDGGATWQDMLPNSLWPGTDQRPGDTLVFPDPGQDGTIFLAAADFPGGANDPSGLLRSEDHGQNWTAVETGLNDDTHVTAMEFVGSTIYLGTRDGNLYQSVDDGDTWEIIGDSVLESIGILEINSSGNELWATTHYLFSAIAQVARIDLTSPSYEATPVPSWPVDQYPRNLGFLADDKVFVGTQWDGGWITVNDGADWLQFHPSTGKPGYSLALDPWDASKSTFYIADEQYGVQKTTDMLISGTNVSANWQKKNTGLHAMSPDIIAVDPENPAQIYSKIAENGWPGIFTSADGGQNWIFSSIQTALSSEEPEWGDVRPITSTLAVSGGRIFVGFHGNDVWGFGPQLMISDDQGRTWRRVNVDPNPREEYATSFHMPSTLIADPNTPDNLLLSAVIGDRSLTSDQFVSEIYRSTDRGETWQRVNLFDQIGNEVNNLFDMGFDPHDSDIVYASDMNNIYKSSDNGLTWSSILHEEEFPVGGQVAVEPVPPYRVYVGNLVSPDGGTSWNPAPNMPVSPDQIVFVPGTDTVYIAGDGLAVSYDGGTTWQLMPGGMGNVKITSLAIGRDDQRVILYLGTPGGEAQGSALVSDGSEMAYSPSLAASSAILDAGVYRLTTVQNKYFLPFISQP
jgi:photosystem II stability/assembly factor-like uncharacterized protein